MRAALPPSVSCFWINSVGVVFYFLLLFLLHAFTPALGAISISVIGFIGSILVIIVLEIKLLRVHTRAKNLKAPDARVNLKRVSLKWLGLAVTLAVVLGGLQLFWNVFYTFRLQEMYPDIYAHVAMGSALFLALGYWYIGAVDRRMLYPQDAYFQVGLLACGQFSRVDWRYLPEHFRGWAVKGFFLPLMMTGTWVQSRTLLAVEGEMDFIALYTFSMAFWYCTDVFMGTAGYIMTFKWLDSNIRSTDATWRGWLVTIVCYPPFWEIVALHHFLNMTEHHWHEKLAAYPLLQMALGTAIVLLTFIYASATISFGYRFSNLTYRGLITNGCYRFTKHPAYVSKNLFWWCMILPFIFTSPPNVAVMYATLIGIINLIYYARARTEENHLSHYPEYVAYAEMMNERSIFRGLATWIPYFRYDYARAMRSGSGVWWKKFPQTQQAI